MGNKRARQETNQELLKRDLAVVFEKSSKLDFETNKDGIVTVLLKQDHLIQRWLRKLGMDIPQYRRMKLDAKGSFVFLHLDGHVNVEGLGELMEAEFGDKAQPVYPRLLTFLNYMERDVHYINRVQP